jgi:Fic family protein
VKEKYTKEMSLNYTPVYTLDASILSKIESISQKEGQLRAMALSVEKKMEMVSLSTVDAVHFSTKLEGNALTLEQVTQALFGKSPKHKAGRDLQEVLNYSKAKSKLAEYAKRDTLLTKSLVLKTHTVLMSNIVEGRLKGCYRTSQNVIHEANSKAIVYLPPTVDDVVPLMKSLLDWVNRSLLEGVSALIVAPIFHYYFVTIHPFLDGNGRSARLLTYFILTKQGMVISEFAALEKQHEHNRAAYYSQLRRLQAETFYDISPTQNLTSWVTYWLDCLNSTYDEALLRCTEASDVVVEEGMEPRLRKGLALFKTHPRLTAAQYQVLMGLGRTQAVADLNQLVAKGFIQKLGSGRTVVYRAF